MIKRITLLIFIGLTFGSRFLPAQTITNVQARQEGLEIIITYDMAGMLDREQTPGLQTMDSSKVLVQYE
jgi:hypothetical protein